MAGDFDAGDLAEEGAAGGELDGFEVFAAAEAGFAVLVFDEDFDGLANKAAESGGGDFFEEVI